VSVYELFERPSYNAARSSGYRNRSFDSYAFLKSTKNVLRSYYAIIMLLDCYLRKLLCTFTVQEVVGIALMMLISFKFMA